MPRYLTPSRICLLALIDLYLPGHMPLSAKLGVLSFIASHIRQPTLQEIDGNEAASPGLSSDATAFAPSLGVLASSIPGRSIYDVFLPRLWDLTGLDSLHVLFGRLMDLTALADPTLQSAQGRISRASPLGQYIRRCNVEFTRLPFADSQALWAVFEVYRAPTYESWMARNIATAAKCTTDHLSLSEMSSAGWPVISQFTIPDFHISAEDTDGLITFSIHQLQKLGTRLPDNVKHTLQCWITDQSDSGVQSLQHFLAFFESWRAGQYTMALESLHRYFDYSLVAKNPNSRGEENMRVYYQYALLHLSVLHADFDCWDESVDAMEECIATARENQDTACLNFALSWLLYLRQANPNTSSKSFEIVGEMIGSAGGEQDEIAFLKTKAKETKHWSLMSSTLLEEAKLEMYSGGNTNKSVEHILQSGYLNVQHDLLTLMPAYNLFHGASFDRLGQAHLSSRIYESIQFVHSRHCPLGDRVRADCRVAYSLARCGQYASAMGMLDNLSPVVEGVLKLEQRVDGFTSLVQMTRSVQRDDLEAAQYYLSQLRILRGFTDPELGFEITMIELDYLAKRQDFDLALRIANTHLQHLRTSGGSDIAQRLHLLLAKGRIFASALQPAKAFSITLRAASTAHRFLLMPLVLEAIALLCAILSDLGEFTASQALVEAILPSALDVKNVKLTADLFATLAQSLVGIAAGSKGAEQTKTMMRAEEFVERSRSAYAGLESFQSTLDCLAMKARLARWRGDESTAAQADEVYSQVLADKGGQALNLI